MSRSPGDPSIFVATINCFTSLNQLSMKQLNALPLIIATLVTLVLPGSLWAQPSANLSISRISPQGTLVQGTGNRIRVTIVNSGPVGVSGNIPIVMTLTQGRKNTTVQRTLSGIGPNDRNGQTVMFNNLTLKSAGQVTVKVQIDPRRRIRESDRANNRKTQNFTVESQPSTQSDGSTLTVQVYHQGSWGYQGANTVKGIANAQVLVERYGSTLRTGTTDSTGRWSGQGVPSGALTVTITKHGFYKKGKTFQMTSSPKVINMEMKPGG